MNIYVTGFGGFIGQALKTVLEDAGHQVCPIPHFLLKQGGEQLSAALKMADVIVNLAGESIMGRWTEKKKREIMDSRVITTRNLVTALSGLEVKPLLFINASAVGIYPADSYSDEFSVNTGNDFLAQVVKAWEAELEPLKDVRKVILRFGIVIGKKGGVLKKLEFSAHLGIPLVLGSGWQPFPVIHIDDVCGFILYAVQNEQVEGIYNLVISDIPAYKEFAEAVAGIRKPFFTVRIPENVLKWVMGESATMLTSGANVIPKRLSESGYDLKFSKLSMMFK